MNSKIVYKRKLFWKLNLLRCAFFLCVTSFIFLLYTDYSDYSVLPGILLCFLCFSGITGLYIQEDGFVITSYFFGGVFFRSYSCDKNDKFDISTTLIGGETHSFDDDGELLPLIIQNVFQKQYTYKRHSVLIKNAFKDTKIVIDLNDKEYELLFNLYLRKTVTQ